MITENNLFEKGMLISLKIGTYEGRKKLSKEQMAGLETDICRGVHDLFDKDFKDKLKAISSHDFMTRQIVMNNSIPFPIDGIYFLPSNKIDMIIDKIEERKTERSSMVLEVLEDYQEAIGRFAEKYPDYYRHSKGSYPMKEALAAKFYVQYQFLKISAPSESDSIISPEVYKNEMKKFKETIDEMKKEVTATIYTELLETTIRLKKQCTDGKPNQRTINTVNEYIKKIDDIYSDFLDREDMKTAIDSIRKQMIGVTAERLRNVDSAKEKFRKEISEIVGGIKNLPDIPLKRAIDF